MGLAIRRVRSEVPTFDELRLPSVMETLADSPRGLVLITGPTGTGKTTTIASMIGHINRSRRAHIVTIEDPIEVVHDDVLSIVQQREIGIDTDSYANALKHVIRQDPDVIFVGEIRDGDSALSRDPGGGDGSPRHLDAAHDRLHGDDQPHPGPVPALPAEGGAHLVRRVACAGSCRSGWSRRRTGRAGCPTVEVLVNTGRVFDRIVDSNTTDQIVDVISEGEFYGMQTFDQSLVKLVSEGLVTEDDARRAGDQPARLRPATARRAGPAVVDVGRRGNRAPLLEPAASEPVGSMWGRALAVLRPRSGRGSPWGDAGSRTGSPAGSTRG